MIFGPQAEIRMALWGPQSHLGEEGAQTHLVLSHQGPGYVPPAERTRPESAELEEETGAQRGSVLAQTDRQSLSQRCLMTERTLVSQELERRLRTGCLRPPFHTDNSWQSGGSAHCTHITALEDVTRAVPREGNRGTRGQGPSSRSQRFQVSERDSGPEVWLRLFILTFFSRGKMHITCNVTF